MSTHDVTALIRRWQEGDKDALDEALPLVYEELRRLARHYLTDERSNHTLQPTALVHEAYVRLTGQREVDWKNRSQLVGVAAQMMRRILLNHAEAKSAGKRHAQHITLDRALDLGGQVEFDLLVLEEALKKLGALDAEQERLVELRFFGGLSIEETAEVLGVSPATVKREWSLARAWLLREITGTAKR